MGVPHSIWWGLGVGIGSFLAFFAFEYSIERGQERKGSYVTLTPFKRKRDMKTGDILQVDEEVDFDPRHGHYMKCGEVLIALASASLVFIPLHSTLLPRTGISGVFLGISMVLLGFTVVYALLFMALLTYFYEMFLFDPASFKAFRSSLIFTLGFSAFACFAMAYLSLAIVMAKAFSSG
ncbi:MAG: hypothetical protein ACLQBK_04460 [Candidatus Sulfotelmatobacter sp.]